MLEELDPGRVRGSLRIEQDQIEAGCHDLSLVVDVGRNLFLRSFTLADGYGNDLAGTPGTRAGPRARPNFRRFQKGHFGGPDATRCVDCHWRGGLAGAGDRADNSYLFGDGDDLSSADARNAPALMGVGWAELVAREMSEELLAIADTVRARAVAMGESATAPLLTKGVFFGTIRATPGENGEAQLDTTDVVGVDADLVVKPFGWKGVFPSLREFLFASTQLHLGLQSEEALARRAAYPELDFGNGPDPEDPDADGVTRELTQGQLTAMVLFLATLSTPVIDIPVDSVVSVVEDPWTTELELGHGPDFAIRWSRGYALFESLGCASCHVPFMTVQSPVYRTTPTLSGRPVEVDLASFGARPRPADGEGGEYLVPVFSDFKRHDMGPRLESQHVERGVPRREYLTPRLWGLANSSPYLHTGAATSVQDAIHMHDGEAAFAAQAFRQLEQGEASDLLMFLQSLVRAPAIRIR